MMPHFMDDRYVVLENHGKSRDILAIPVTSNGTPNCGAILPQVSPNESMQKCTNGIVVRLSPQKKSSFGWQAYHDFPVRLLRFFRRQSCRNHAAIESCGSRKGVIAVNRLRGQKRGDSARDPGCLDLRLRLQELSGTPKNVACAFAVCAH